MEYEVMGTVIAAFELGDPSPRLYSQILLGFEKIVFIKLYESTSAAISL
ncbi:hypothetical protein QFZ87_003130 [Bacillus sp. SLBN-46]|nr:hypothetical protein [Bacillus sp. SLBN-46]